MINNAYDIILGALAPVIESQKFTRQGDEYVFVNDKHAFRVTYDNTKHVFLLDMSDLVEGGEAEFYNLSSYLFEDNADERDARSVGGDFLDSLNNALGIRRSAALNRRDVPLPSKRAAADETPGVDAFCGRFLTLFPQYKDLYREDVLKYNGFMYDDFFSKTAAVELRGLTASGSPKQFVKLVSMLDDNYVDGDYDVQSTISYSIIGEAFRADPTLLDRFKTLCAENETGEHLTQPADCMMKYVISKGK